LKQLVWKIVKKFQAAKIILNINYYYANLKKIMRSYQYKAKALRY